MSEIIMLTGVRLSFPALTEARASAPNSPAKFGCDVIIDMQSPQWVEAMKQVVATATEKWSDKAQGVLSMIQQDKKFRCYGQGNEKINKKTFAPYDGYEGMGYISAANANAPQAIKPNGAPVDATNTMEYQAIVRKMYGGCYVNVAIKFWPQDNQHGRAVRCELVAIQFNKDGESFGDGGTPDVSSMFGTVAASAELPAAPVGGMPAMPSFLS